MKTATPRKIPPLRAVREARGFSLRELSRQTDIDEGQLSKMERGLQGVPVHRLLAVARVLGLTELARVLAPWVQETPRD